MSGKDKRIKPLPSRSEVEQVLIKLINGETSPEDASTWASYWLVNDFWLAEDFNEVVYFSEARASLSG